MSNKIPERSNHPLARFFLLDVFANERARPALLWAVFSIAAAAVLYRWLEGWSWTDSFYFVVITFATIGYGDLVPTQPLTKVITIFVSLNGVIVLLMLIDVVRRVRSWDVPARPLEQAGDDDRTNEPDAT